MLHRQTPLQTCHVCGAQTPILRRGRCPVCYLRWAQQRPVGLGASCIICGERRYDHLQMVEFQLRWLPMCFSCSGRGFRLHPLPMTLDELRQRLERNRRDDERRFDAPDRRIFQINRRGEERRSDEPPGGIECLDASDLIVEILEEEMEGEATCIVDAMSLESRVPPAPELRE